MVALSVGGCGRKSGTVGTKAAGTEVSAIEPAKASDKPMTVEGTGLKPVHDDPAQDGWDSERANDALAAPLAALKQVVASGDPAGAEAAKSLDAIATATAEIGALTAPEWRIDFQGPDGLTVRRGEPKMPAGTGLTSLQKALGDWLDKGAEPHAYLKVLGVALDPAARTIDARIDVELDTVRPDGTRRQHNGEWHTTWSLDTPPRLTKLTASACEEVTGPAHRAFEDWTESALGKNASWKQHLVRPQDHWAARMESSLGLEGSSWHGIAVADVDGDGRDDVFFPEEGGLPNRLFHHEADGTARDVTAEAGLDWLDLTRAALFADFDNDGDPDLAASLQEGVIFAENDGRGHFKPRSTVLAAAGFPFGLAAADYDGDGDLDLFAACYHQRQGVLKNFTFARPVPYHDATNGAPDLLLRNDGGWQFAQAGPAAGLDEGGNNKFGFAPAWDDFDGDGLLDCFVANDFGRKNLWRQQRAPDGLLRFVDMAPNSAVLDVGAGMSACWGDVDNDGRPDLLVGNMFSSAGNRIVTQSQFMEGVADDTKALYRRHAKGNSLFLNQGNGSFDDVSEESGIALGRWAWSSKMADFDNDGWQDLYVANGYLTQDDPHDL